MNITITRTADNRGWVTDATGATVHATLRDTVAALSRLPEWSDVAVITVASLQGKPYSLTAAQVLP